MLKASGMMSRKKKNLCQRDIKVDTLNIVFCCQSVAVHSVVLKFTTVHCAVKTAYSLHINSCDNYNF